MKGRGGLPGPDWLWILLRVVFLFLAGACIGQFFFFGMTAHEIATLMFVLFFDICVYENGYREGYKRFGNNLKEASK